MPALTHTEENYLKAIYKVNEHSPDQISTNAIAVKINTSAASVTDMIKKLSAKDLLIYEPYKGVRLSPSGMKIATNLVRKHRLWETFLHQKLNFDWHEVHDIAEQLEHIQSDELVDRLDNFLSNPKFDPHGDPIPNAEGRYTIREQTALNRTQAGMKGVIVGVKNHETSFLNHLNKLQIGIGSKIEIEEISDFDKSIEIKIDDGDPLTISNQIASNLFMRTTV